MKKATHTPGPWSLAEPKRQKKTTIYDHNQEVLVMAAAPSFFQIASVGGPSNVELYDTFVANARLIAAAPELLAACEYVVKWHRENDSGEGELFGLDLVTDCICAIRKAKGE